MRRAATGILAALLGASSGAAQKRPDADPWTRWWSEMTSSGRRAAAGGIVRTGAKFEQIYRQLEAGRGYPPNAPTGVIERTRLLGPGLEHPFSYLVPADYDPAKRYPVRFYLHGGIGRPDPGRWRNPQDQARPGEIAAFPSGSGRALWWQWSQVDNFAAILGELKQRYNVDENRVYLFGVSDGGTGAYYQAFKAPTIWAGYVVLIGHPAVLANPRFRESGELFARNLAHQAFFVANAEHDRLYPVSMVKPFVDLFVSLGADLTFRPEDGDHSVSWWPAEADRIEQFITAHPRDPLPDRLDWETERVDRGNRFRWLVIDELGDESERREALIDDPFPHFEPSGRVIVEREGNVVKLRTFNVRRLTLLLSPAKFDFQKPLTVMVEGKPIFSGPIAPSAARLLDWAALDDDRTMLFGAELEVRVSGSGKASARFR